MGNEDKKLEPDKPRPSPIDSVLNMGWIDGLRKRFPAFSLLLLFAWQLGENVWDSYKSLPQRLDDQSALITKLSENWNEIESRLASVENSDKDYSGSIRELSDALDSYRIESGRERLATSRELVAVSDQLADVAKYLDDLGYLRRLYNEMNQELKRAYEQRERK